MTNEHNMFGRDWGAMGNTYNQKSFPQNSKITRPENEYESIIIKYPGNFTL